MDIKDLENHLDSYTYGIFFDSNEFCRQQIRTAKRTINKLLSDEHISTSDVCFVAVGSIGRCEALYASDLDIIPILKNRTLLEQFKRRDTEFRKVLASKLNLPVSKGTDLTSCMDIASLTDPETIGGDKDNNSALTKRVLILTEGIQIGGTLSLKKIKRDILSSYASSERTRGRHVLSLCNDIARYYRTLCIDYKCKVDVEDKAWGTRNIKLRHSRKFWYFSCMFSLVTIARDNPKGTEGTYTDEILKALSYCPILRIAFHLHDEQRHLLTALLKYYGRFLKFMADADRRFKLDQVLFSNKNDFEFPYLQMKLNSELLHSEILHVINSIDAYRRKKLMDWFLL